MGRRTHPATSAAWCARVPLPEVCADLCHDNAAACLPACLPASAALICRRQADAPQPGVHILT